MSLADYSCSGAAVIEVAKMLSRLLIHAALLLLMLEAVTTDLVSPSA